MLVFVSILVMLLVAYAHWREGIFTAFCTLVNIFFSGLVCFMFFEPLADELEPLMKSMGTEGYEDSLALVLLFALTLGVLRVVTNNLANTELEFPAPLAKGGGALLGLISGYLVAGFLVCVLQTLPWHENFMYFEARVESSGSGTPSRRLLPPDRVWLALMHRAGALPFSWGEGPTFDPHGEFEFRYARYRRYNDTGKPLPDDGALPGK
jgi:hypothetical protein